MLSPNKDDREYINRVTARIPRPVKYEMITAYKAEWLRAYDAEQIEHKKDNAGRFAANTLMRKLARKYMETNTTGIPRICGNCDHCQTWQGQHYCNRFKQEIPADYISEENNCEEYQNEVPF
ncbi:hypothetical protein N22_046 [Idiomarinaceae phage 1N2-2]|uniref:hypothetical protein n=1 Tax=Idiomarinaceae phage 1N2-2 TaxID=1536592 RepID=UPI0004F5A660|nr:hypothetical protein N22_046 [Idiomarinaceae phage 1N2-2]AIM40748.1 hypothetical protein N22_046 [Idiomarinaceae phage 1N2-2]